MGIIWFATMVLRVSLVLVSTFFVLGYSQAVCDLPGPDAIPCIECGPEHFACTDDDNESCDCPGLTHDDPADCDPDLLACVDDDDDTCDCNLGRKEKSDAEHKTVAVGHYTCWPTSVGDQPVVLDEDGLWRSEANEKVKDAIAKDPENTICSRTYWFLQGWSVKCSRAPFRSFRCEAGIRSTMWSKEKYYYPKGGAWNNRIHEELLD